MIHAHEEASFVQWMRETNNMFTGEEYKTRLGIWLSNKRLVQEHNKAKNFLLSMNHLAHYTPAEYKAILGFKQNAQNSEASAPSNYKAPESLDWREKNVVNAIKDQGQCGSCWAFSIVQSVEGCYAAQKGTLYSLSEQQIVDCVTACEGCDGGLMTAAFDWVIKHQDGGFMGEDDYPYHPYETTCAFDKSKVKVTIIGYKEIEEGSEKDLAAKCASQGPISIGIDASNWSFQMYSGGIYDEPSCSSYNLDHGVGCVGYGSESGTKYWIVRNSWGEDWGEKGYIRMVKDKNNQCGEASLASYPTF
jgi:cathepsin L